MTGETLMQVAPGKFIHGLRSGARALGFEKGATDLIQFTRGQARVDLLLHSAQGFGTDAPDGFEMLNIVLRISGHSS